jgi:hypothetical protein
LTPAPGADGPGRAGRVALRHDAVRAPDRRLEAEDRHGAVAVGHPTPRPLHLALGVRKTDRPLDPKHFARETCGEANPSQVVGGDRAADVAAPLTDRAWGRS